MSDEYTETGLEIAVIGMSCRFPGARHIHQFWQNLNSSVESITFLGNEELEKTGLSSSLLEDERLVKTSGGILEDIEYFDAAFFNYTPNEAEHMAPQVRIFHECLWETLENAGYVPDTFAGQIGLYTGVSSTNNWEILSNAFGLESGLNRLSLSFHNSRDYLSTFCSYKFNLTGPSFLVHTTCSTSLVAVHLAYQGLLSGDSDMALAGGVTVRISENQGYLWSEGMIGSPDGHCRAFDAKAKGCGGGDGVGIVALRRLRDALEDGDHIYAVIKGSAINNDGHRKVGFAAPSVEGQAEVIRKAFQMAEINPDHIGYIEAHGTATPLGDVTEIEALKVAFNTSKRNYCGIGSVKTNFGHLDTAAGIAGFIKTVLSLVHKQQPASLHFHNPNPRIDFENSPFYINTSLKEWPRSGKPLLACVSSFGIGGTNAHVVLEEAPTSLDPQLAGKQYPESLEHHLLLFSARTQSALDKMTENFSNYLEHSSRVNLADVAFTLQTGRKSFPFRKKVICTTVEDAVSILTQTGSPGCQTYIVNEKNEKKPVVFVFPGLGSQYVNMGLGIYRKIPRFRHQLDQCFTLLQEIAGFDIKPVLFPGECNIPPARDIQHMDVSQYVVFIFSYCLADLLISWGITPAAVIGYSFGEYAAACAAGVFSLKDALRLIAARGRLLSEVPPGLMLSVPLTRQELEPLLIEGVNIGIDNGSSCVVSGPQQAVASLEVILKKRKLFCMRLDTNFAIHSEMMTPLLKRFEKMVAMIPLKPPQIPFISSVTGDWLRNREATSPSYWASQLKETVCFSEGLGRLTAQFEAVFLEVGSGRDISALISREIEKKPGNHVVPLVRRRNQKVADEFLLKDRIGQLWLYGVPVAWNKFYIERRRSRVPLPTYPFERERFGKLADSYREGKRPGWPGTGRNDLGEWFYLPLWRRSKSPVPLEMSENAKNNWLLFVDGAGLGEKVVRLLSNVSRLILVRRGLQFKKTGHDEYLINPGHYVDYENLLADISQDGQIPDKILHAWGVTIAKNSEPVSMDESLEPGFYSLLYLAKALGRNRKFKDKIDINVVTNHIQEVVGGEFINPYKAVVLGPCKVIPQEYPNICCRCIDIDFTGVPDLAAEVLPGLLATELTTGQDDLTAAYRENRRWVQVYAPTRLFPREKPDLLQKKGVYWIIGGLGDIGYTLAQYLVKRFGAKLLLTGRTEIPPRTMWEKLLIISSEKDKVYQDIRKLQHLETLGGDVIYYSTDIADRYGMTEALEKAENQLGPVNGIIHSAGIIEDESFKTINDLDTSDCLVQFQAKVKGLMVLQEVLAGQELDFFLMISSISTFLGGLGFAAYAAANHFADAFSRRCNQEGETPWIIVDWDGTSSEDTARAFHLVFSSFPIEQVIFSRGGDFEARFSRWVQKKESHDKTIEQESGFNALYKRQLTTPYIAPRNQVEQKLADIWERFFGIEKISVTDDFFDLGGDSLKAVNILAIIQKELQVSIPIKEFFDNSTIEGVAAILSYMEKNTYLSIVLAEKKDYYPLSAAQSRLYILQQIEPDSIAYNSPMILNLEGNLDRYRFEEAFKRLIRRHGCLRTSIGMIKGEPAQKIHKPGEVEFSAEFYETDEDRAKEIILHFVKPFDLSQPPFLRAGLIKLGETKHILMLDMHHIVTDGVSSEIFINETIALYKSEELPVLRLQYKDYAEWQKSDRVRKAMKKQEEFWLKEFEEEIPVLNLPTDYERPQMQSFEGNTSGFGIGKEETAALKTLSLKEDVTLYMVLFSVFNILFSKLSGQEDIIIGTPVAGRRHIDLHNIMGVFVNTLALRNYPASEKTFKEFLNEVKVNTLKAFENQEYQFEDLIEQVVLNRDMSRNPLFDVMFVLQNVEIEPGEKSNVSTTRLKVAPYDYKRKTSKFDLTLVTNEFAHQLYFTLEYCAKLFKRETIERFIRYFKKILQAIQTGVETKISQIEIISEEERYRQLVEFNDTKADFPMEKRIHELFEEQVERSPDKISIIFKDRELSYRELNVKSNQLARKLREKRVGPDSVVSILIERSLEMMVGIFGILKAGGAYLPIDPEYPPERKQYILRDSRVNVLLTRECFLDTIENGCELMCLEDSSLYCGDGNNLGKTYTGAPENLAYVIYTSGSTGKPKGVMIQHQSVVNRLNWMQRFYSLGERDVILQKTPYVFDVSVWELFWWSLQGASLYLLKPGEEKDPQAIIDAVEKENITTMHFVPSMLGEFLAYLEGSKAANKLLSLRQLFSSGERLTVPHVEKFKKLLNETKLINLYGPTEATVDVSYFDCSKNGKLERIPIGKPIDNISLHVVDKHLKLQPPGITGDLYIAGIGLSRGYLNRPQLTAEKFVSGHLSLVIGSSKKIYKSTNDQCPMTNDRLYKTGDLARWLPDGNIEFLGREDQQVKIRGFRIELGEIESCLLKHDALIEVVVVQKKDKIGDKFLCAYYVADHALEGDSLRQFLAKDLPGYMVPSFFVQIEKIPLNSNGKLDPGALPHPIIKIEKLYVAPQNDIEKSLVKIWADILGIQEQGIGINANFFEIGGHSLKAVTLASKIQKEFNVELPLSEIFVEPTIGSMAAKIGQKHETKYIPIKSVEEKGFYSLSSAQKRFYLLQHLEPNSTALNMVRVYQFEGRMEEENLVRIFQQLIHRHEALRTSFYFLNDGPVQRIHPTVHFKLQTDNCTENDINDYLKKFVRPFDLSRAPLLRVMLLQTGTECFFLLFDIHHIICDAVSMDILITDFITLYRGESLMPLTHHYRDYVTWEKEFLSHEKVKLLENYWLEKLDGFTFTSLPIDHYKTNLPIPGNNLRLKLDTVISHKIEQFCNRHAITKFTFFMAVLNIVLAIEIDQRDITIAIPIVNRNHHQLDSIIGLFLNVLLIRNEVQLKGTFEANLERVKQTVIEAMDNHLYPYELLKQEIRERRNWKENELFSILFNYFLVEQSSQKKFEPFRISSVGSEVLVPKYDITLYISDYGDLIDFNVVYKGNIYSDIRIQRLLEDCKNVIFKIIEDGQILVQDILARDNDVPMEFRGDHNQFDEMDDLLL